MFDPIFIEAKSQLLVCEITIEYDMKNFLLKKKDRFLLNVQMF